MSLETLGNLGEFVGAAGVVISLLFVVRQMKLNTAQTRRNTKSVRAATFNSMVENSIRLLEHVFRDHELADFLARIGDPDHDPTKAELLRWNAYMTAVFRHFGNLVYQCEIGAIEQKMWESYRRSFKDHLRDGDWVGWYLNNPHLFDQRLADEVRSILDELAEEGAPHAVVWKKGGGRIGFKASLRRTGTG